MPMLASGPFILGYNLSVKTVKTYSKDHVEKYKDEKKDQIFLANLNFSGSFMNKIK